MCLNLKLIIKKWLIKLKNKIMAIISSYPTVAPELQDLLLGIEKTLIGGEDAPKTRTFTIQSVTDLIATKTLQQIYSAGNSITVPNLSSNGIITTVPTRTDVATSDAKAFLAEIYGQTTMGMNGNVHAFSASAEGIDNVSFYSIHSDAAQSKHIQLINDLSTNSDFLSCFLYPDTFIAGIDYLGNITGTKFVKTNGSSNELLMANGTVRNINNFNNSTSLQGITAATVTYLTGSNISTDNIKAGTVVTWNISVTKTAAGVVAPIFNVKLGTTGTTTDSTLLTFTGSAQTAVVDNGSFTIRCTFRSVGSGTTAVLVGDYTLMHNLQTTGLSVLPINYGFATSTGFNSTVTGSVLGITVDTGAAAVWTINQVNVKMENQA